MGCIDGTHIPVHKPLYCAQDYFTRKQIYAIQVQAVCDERLMFTHIFAGFCGGSHNSYVMQNSQLFLDYKSNIKRWFSEPEYHLVGDCAYPLLSYLLKPFPEKEGMSKSKRLYNKSLSGCRHTIERAFGLLKNKWKILGHPFTHNTEKTILIAVACCVLHNFCIVHGGSADVQDFLTKPTISVASSMTEEFGPKSIEGQRKDAQRKKEIDEDFIMSSALTVKWKDIGLEGKEKESHILKKFKKC